MGLVCKAAQAFAIAPSVVLCVVSSSHALPAVLHERCMSVSIEIPDSDKILAIDASTPASSATSSLI